jgi:hypothetical protein
VTSAHWARSEATAAHARQGAFAGAAALAHLQFLFTVKPSKAFVIHVPSLPSKQHMQAAIAEPTPPVRQCPNAQPHVGLAGTAAAVAYRCAFHAQYSARPPLAHPMHRTGMSHGLPFGGGRHHFRELMSFKTAISSIASANSFFSFPFSSSSA